MTGYIRGSATVSCQAVVQRRESVLLEQDWFPCDLAIGSVSRPTDLAKVRATVDRCGVALLDLGDPLDADGFIGLAQVFGVPEAESAATLMHRVDRRVILNLKPDSRGVITEANQPFTSEPLTFHVEGSRRPRGTSPAYLLFQCLGNPQADHGGQTILRSIDDVLANLSRRSFNVLTATVLNPASTDATVIYDDNGKRTLNFRDPAPNQFEWDSPFRPDEVVDALTQLLTAVYDRGKTIGVPWRPGMLAIVDNKRWLHARTSGGTPTRHLQRIRVQSVYPTSTEARQ